MPCSICGSITHHANDCTSVELLQSVARIKALWLGENMPEGWTEVRFRPTTTPETFNKISAHLSFRME